MEVAMTLTSPKTPTSPKIPTSSKRRILALTLGLIAATGLATGNAAADKLSNSEIKSLVGGKKVFLATRWGEFPLYYAPNGRVTGDGTGMGLARYFAPKETGQWYVDNNRLCQRFPTWYKGKTSCFTLTRTGENKLRWRRDDGYSGSARIGG
jgi:hypothetical protein